MVAKSDGDLERIVEALKAGIDKEKNEQKLHDALLPRLRGFFRKKGASEDLTADLIQNTFMRIYHGVEGYRGDGSARGWVLTIAHNCLRQHRDKSWRSPQPGPSLDDSEGLDGLIAEIDARDLVSRPRRPDEWAEKREMRRALREAWMTLPREQYLCLGFWLQGYLIREIAVALRKSPGTVKALLHHARKSLRDRLLGPEGERQAGGPQGGRR